MKFYRVTFECESWDEDGQYESENYLYYKTEEEANAAVEDFEQMVKDGEIPFHPDSSTIECLGVDEIEVPTDPKVMLDWVRKNQSTSGQPDLISNWDWYN